MVTTAGLMLSTASVTAVFIVTVRTSTLVSGGRFSTVAAGIIVGAVSVPDREGVAASVSCMARYTAVPPANAPPAAVSATVIRIGTMRVGRYFISCPW